MTTMSPASPGKLFDGRNPIVELVTGLHRDRAVEIGRDLGIPVATGTNRDRQIAQLLLSARLDLGQMLRRLSRDELREACRRAGLDDSGRVRIDAIRRRHEATAGISAAPRVDVEEPRELFLPVVGDFVIVRQRQYLAQDVGAGEPERYSFHPMMLARLSCPRAPRSPSTAIGSSSWVPASCSSITKVRPSSRTVGRRQ